MKLFCPCGEAYDISIPFGHQIIDVHYSLTDEPLPANEKVIKDEAGKERCRSCKKRTVYVFSKGSHTGIETLKPHLIEKLVHKLSFSYWAFRPVVCLFLGLLLTTVPMSLLPFLYHRPDLIPKDAYVFYGFQAGFVFFFFFSFWKWVRVDFGELEEHIKEKKFRRILIALKAIFSPLLFVALTTKLVILSLYFATRLSTASRFSQADVNITFFQNVAAVGWNVPIAMTLLSFTGYLAALIRLCFSRGIFVSGEKYENVKAKADKIFLHGNHLLLFICLLLILRNYTQLPFLQTKTLSRLNQVTNLYGLWNALLIPFGLLILAYGAFAIFRFKLSFEIKKVYEEKKEELARVYTLQIIPFKGGSRLNFITSLVRDMPTAEIFDRKKDLNTIFKDKFSDTIDSALAYSGVPSKGEKQKRKRKSASVEDDFYQKVCMLGDELYTLYIKKNSGIDYHFKQSFEKPFPTVRIEAMEEDASIPWELLRVKDDFLCLQANTLRVLTPYQEKTHLSFQGNVLLVGANPQNDLEKIEEECQIIKAIFEDADMDVTVLLNQDATRENFKEALKTQKYLFLHFTGHSAFNEEDPKRSVLKLQDGDLHVFELTGTISPLERKPSLIFLNSCESAVQEHKKRKKQHVQGLANSLIKTGVLCVVGMQWKVSEQGAIKLASTFYRDLLNRKLPEEALRHARYEAGYETKFRDPVWASPVIYGV